LTLPSQTQTQTQGDMCDLRKISELSKPLRAESHYALVVNTWLTSNVRQILHGVNFPYNPKYLADVAITLASKVAGLKTKYNVPSWIEVKGAQYLRDGNVPGFLPRYYMILFRADESEVEPVEIELYDILGVKRAEANGEVHFVPSPWGYKHGYWHPMINTLLRKTLTLAAKKAEKGDCFP